MDSYKHYMVEFYKKNNGFSFDYIGGRAGGWLAGWLVKSDKKPMAHPIGLYSRRTVAKSFKVEKI